MTGRTQPLAYIPGLRELASQQAGIVHRDQLAALGVTKNHVRSQLRAQRWQAITPNVIGLMTGVLTEGQLQRSALLHAGPRALLDDRTVLSLGGLRGWESGMTHVLAPHGVVISPMRGVVFHRSRHLDGADATIHGGVRCTTVERAAVNAASRQRSPRSASGLVIAVVQQRLSTPLAMLECLERLTKVRHVDAIRDSLVHAAGGADSLSEVDVTRLLRRAGLTSFRRQHVVRTADGPRPYDVVVDLPDGTLLLVEVDGVFHDDPVRRARDLAKDAAATALGHQVLRIPVHLLRPEARRIEAQFEEIRRAAEARFGSAKAPRVTL